MLIRPRGVARFAGRAQLVVALEQEPDVLLWVLGLDEEELFSISGGEPAFALDDHGTDLEVREVPTHLPQLVLDQGSLGLVRKLYAPGCQIRGYSVLKAAPVARLFGCLSDFTSRSSGHRISRTRSDMGGGATPARPAS